MKLKDIKEHFSVTPYNEKGEYLLYKNTCYSGTIIYDAKKETVELKSPLTYTDDEGVVHNYTYHLGKGCEVRHLLEDIENLKKTLPFPLDCYNPTYRKSWFVDSCLYHYFTNMGFVHCQGAYKNTVFKLTNTNSCGFSGDVTFIITPDDMFADEVSGTISMYLSSSKSMDFHYTSLDDAIKSINGMLKLAFASSMVFMVEKSKMFADKEISLDGVELREQDANNPFVTYTSEVKQQTIELLESMLADLKKC